MYKKEIQLTFEDFVFPFGELDSENEWVKLAGLVPWETVEREYAKQFVDNGHPAHSARIALGALIIKQRLKCSDEWTVRHVSENPYLQFYLGMKAYSSKAPFGASTMVEFRKRFPPEAVAAILEASIPKKPRKDHDDQGKPGGSGGQNAGQTEPETPPNSGTLIMDATCCPADIMLFNLIGTVVCLTVFYGLNAVIPFSFVEKPIRPVEVAAVHSIFNIVTTLILLPFTDHLVRLAKRIVPSGKAKEAIVLLDKRLITTPPLAVSQCREKTVEMSVIAREALQEALAALFDISEKAVQSVEEKEQTLDGMEDMLSTFLLELSSVSLTVHDSRIVTELLHCISDFERISDHAINMTDIAQEMKQEGLAFSANARADFATLFAALIEISELTVKAFSDDDATMALQVEPLEEVIDDLTKAIRDKHIERLRRGECSPELGVYLSDLLINCERVSDHCSNIAVSIIQISMSSMNSHDYLSSLKAGRSPQFIENYTAYGQKYRLAEG